MARDIELIRLLVVDDHEIVRVGLCTLFSRYPEIRVVGEAGTAVAAVQQALRLKPDVVLMDVRLPDGSGVEACREIRAACPSTRVLYLTSYEDDEAVRAATFSGASGYLLKEVGGEALVNAIKTTARGQSIVDPLAARLSDRSVGYGEPAAEKSGSLSAQEKRVLTLVSEGKTNKEIAATLKLSSKTIKNYLSNIFRKLNVTRRSQAVAKFLQRTKDK